MKRLTTILGIISAVLTMVGTIFKFLHWPGASIIITIGATTLAAYMWFYIFVQWKMVTSGMEKGFIALMGTAGIFAAIGFVFKMQHWPGANLIIKVFIILSVLLIVVSLLRVLGEKNEDLRYKYTQTFIWLLGGGVIILFPFIQNLLN
ncbi:MAG: hypothetical protein NT144_07500 [Bacteroidia bacterium]|nr:hypothetical protein [Bacteroidia bacterium]